MNQTKKAYLAITMQSIIIGLSFVSVKTALKSADSFNLLAHRFSITLLCALLFILFSKNKLNLSLKDFFTIAPYSLGFPIFFFLFQTIGLTKISASESGIIYALSPIITFLVAKIFIKEENNKKQIFFMILSVLGVIFINLMKGISFSSSLLAVVLTLISATSFSVYNVFLRKISKNYKPFQIAFVVIVCGFLFFNIFSLLEHLKDKNLQNYFVAFKNIDFIVSILFLSVASSFITILLTTYALSHLQSTTVSLFQNLSTVVSILSAVVILNEKLYYFHYAGIIAVIVGTIGFTLSKDK